ncbi:hypothetical protein J2Z44_002803 [Clostridium punense]|uniref:Transposase n=1 Tax=Clostridium punense TaxID=1054297 RepID=A0ABS4K5B7_9CLOT|nr:MULTISPECIES: hypothetical protein [Clostridium]EQB89542.1 hypothetical protein M918_20120 [Clostridium sp. BL8]MBP2022978.1 hypothetical protein [Clostridium punense]
MYYLKQGNVITLVQEEDSNYESDASKNSGKTSLNMDSIMKRLFTLKNKKPIIDFLNSIYGDDIGYEAEVYYPNVENLNRNINNGLLSFRADLYIEVTYKDKLYDYAIEFQTKYEKDMGIRIFRYGFDKAVKNSMELNKNTIDISFPEPYLIVLEKEKGLEDKINLRIKFPKQGSFNYKINVLKYWEYDLQRLFEENKYLLYPLQLFNYRRFMENLKISKQSEEKKRLSVEKINVHILTTIKNTLEAISEAYKCDKITLEDYSEMLSVIQNLNDYFIDTYNYYKGLSQEVEVMFKSFYDPEVEKRGIIKGFEKGIQKGTNDAKEEIARKLLREGMGYEFVAGITELNLERIKEIAKEIIS